MAGGLTGRVDAVDAHVRDLGSLLRGPARLRRSLLSEVRSGLLDAADAARAAGLDPVAAQRCAVADFGSPAELAPAFQIELLTAQARRSALFLATAFPGLMLGWDLLWSAGIEWGGAPSATVAVLARGQDLLSVAMGLAAVTAFLVLVRGARRDRDPVPIARAIGVVGGVGAGLSTAVTVVMNLAAQPATTRLMSDHPLAVPAYAVSAVVLVLVLRSVTWTLRMAQPTAA
jgi:hypothetical protein